MSVQQIENDKLKLIHWITELHDIAILEEIKKIMYSKDVSNLSDEEKLAVDEALKSIAEKGVIPHNQVMEETEKLYPNLFKK